MLPYLSATSITKDFNTEEICTKSLLLEEKVDAKQTDEV
jgi:hypothetical protein